MRENMLPVAVRIRSSEELALNLDEHCDLNEPCDDHRPQEVFALMDRVTAHPEPKEDSCDSNEEPDEGSKVPVVILVHGYEVVEEENLLGTDEESNKEDSERCAASTATCVFTTSNVFT